MDKEPGIASFAPDNNSDSLREAPVAERRRKNLQRSPCKTKTTAVDLGLFSIPLSRVVPNRCYEVWLKRKRSWKRAVLSENAWMAKGHILGRVEDTVDVRIPEREVSATLAVPLFGYKNHASIDRRHGFIRGWTVTHAAAHDGAQLRNVVRPPNTGSTVWADTAYRSRKNEAWLSRNGFVSDIHQKKPKGRPMSEATARANGRRSKIRAHIEHVFAHRKPG